VIYYQRLSVMCFLSFVTLYSMLSGAVRPVGPGGSRWVGDRVGANFFVISITLLIYCLFNLLRRWLYCSHGGLIDIHSVCWLGTNSVVKFRFSHAIDFVGSAAS
jgi:hypothetical protein